MIPTYELAKIISQDVKTGNDQGLKLFDLQLRQKADASIFDLSRENDNGIKYLTFKVLPHTGTPLNVSMEDFITSTGVQIWQDVLPDTELNNSQSHVFQYMHLKNEGKTYVSKSHRNDSEGFPIDCNPSEIASAMLDVLTQINTYNWRLLGGSNLVADGEL